MDYRQGGYRFVRGNGLEIGALHAPACLPPGVRVEYADLNSKAASMEIFPEINPAALVAVDHVIDLDREGLRKFDSRSQDFVIANMVIEHVANPLAMIEEMFRVVRSGGHVVLSAPDKNYTFDKQRAVTSFEHVREEYEQGVTEIGDDHYIDFVAGISPQAMTGSNKAIASALRRARRRREPVHVWDSDAFSEFLDQGLKLLGVEADCLYERSGPETCLEHFTVWRVRAPVAVTKTLPADRVPAVADVAAAERSEPTEQAISQPEAGVVSPAPRRARAEVSGRLLLCGMHRSGTSILARLFTELGAWLGNEGDFLPPHERDNPDGYWERLDVYHAHVGFLQAMGFDWNRLSGFGPQAFATETATTLAEALRPIAARLSEHEPWLLKDPRLSLLLPAWRQLVPDFVPIVAVRHPLEIAGSLLRSHRGIYPTSYVLALWEKYLLRLLKDLDGQPALFVSYRRLLEAPEAQIERIVRGLTEHGVRGLRTPTPEALANLLKRDLHRHRVDADAEGVLDTAQARLYQLLTQAADQDGLERIDVADWPEPDAELAEFEAAFDSREAEGRRKAETEQSARLISIERASQTILEQMQLQERQRQAIERENARLAQDLAAKVESITDMKERLAENHARMQALRDELSTARQENSALAQRLVEFDRSIADLRGSLSWKVTAPLRWAAGLFKKPRMSYRLEQRLYRWYYGFPGVSYQRKRALVLWLHRHFAFFTRSTQSYVLYRQGNVRRPAKIAQQPRMDATRAAALIARLRRRPKFSIVMPVYNTDRRWLDDAVQSLYAQYYQDWQLCIVDDCSSKPETLRYLAELKDPRIKVHRLEENQGIARATNVALTLVEGDYIGLLDHDDVLTRDALLEVALVLQDEDVELVYSDEDKMDVDGHCHGPIYKPDFSPEYLSSNNYFCHFTVVSRALMEQVGGLRYGYDGAQDFDLVLRLSERAKRIHHIPKVLYHWRMVPSSTAATADAKPYTWEAGRRALNDALDRRGIAGRIDLGPFPNTYHMRRDLLISPLVSIVVPFRDEPELLKTCVGSILKKSTYRNIELVLVDNQSRLPATRALLAELQAADSRIRVVAYDRPFNYSALHNFAVPHARGDYLLLLNNDTEVITPDWIEALLEHAQRPEVAVAGCRLLYPDDTVQHAGVIVGIGSFAGHAHHLLPADHPGYMARPHLLQNVSSVTFACAMLRAEVYQELGGLDEEHLAVAYNDVDFCLRAREKGYLVVYTPHAELYHHESKTRGGENDETKKQRFAAETAYMHHRHAQVIANGDPYYNINFPRDGCSYEVDPDYVGTLPQ